MTYGRCLVWLHKRPCALKRSLQSSFIELARNHRACLTTAQARSSAFKKLAGYTKPCNKIWPTAPLFNFVAFVTTATWRGYYFTGVASKGSVVILLWVTSVPVEFWDGCMVAVREMDRTLGISAGIWPVCYTCHHFTHPFVPILSALLAD